MVKRSFKKAVNCRQTGERYDNGRLKPPAPNAKVVAARRALLGAAADQVVDIRKAENALDVALARGWLTEKHHRAAQAYAAIARNELGRLPVLRGTALQQAMAPAALRVTDEGLGRSGVLTQADYELRSKLAQLDAGKITEREYARAERAHRVAKIDWARVPSADIAAIFDVLMENTPMGPIVGADGAHNDKPEPSKLRQVWLRIPPAAARELFDVCVLGQWPSWLVALINRRALNADQHRRYNMLQHGLEMVAEVVSPPRQHSERAATGRSFTLSSDADPKRQSPATEEVVNYVTPTGEMLFQAVRKKRRTAA